MSFATTGIYTPPTGAENAAPGQVIRSATWNTIFTDIATALTQLGQASYLNGPRTVSGSFTVVTTDSTILVNGSAPTISLPSAATKLGAVYIYGDVAGVFSTNTSTIIPAGAETINGQNSYLLNRDYQAVYLQPVSGGYIIGGNAGNSVLQTSAVVTKIANYTLSNTDSAVIFNQAGTSTLTMPNAATYPGRWLTVKTVQNQLVLASATVIAQLASTVVATTIVTNTAGKWAQLQSDGTNWVIMAGN